MNALQTSSAPEIDALFSGRKEGISRPKPMKAMAELSFAQQRLWFLEQMALERATYAIPMAIALRGALKVQMLECALGALVARHESLRTVFVTVEGQPRQAVLEADHWKLPVTDLSSEVKRHGRLDELLQLEAERGFDLAQGPLFRARLYCLGADHFVLLLAMHHIVSDGWSMGILFRELGELYGRFCRGETAPLPSPAVQYREGSFGEWSAGGFCGCGRRCRANRGHCGLSSGATSAG